MDIHRLEILSLVGLGMGKEMKFPTIMEPRPKISSPGDSDNKECSCNAGVLGSIPGLGRSPGKGSGYPLQYFCLENSMHRGVCWLQSVESQGVRHDWNSDSFIWLPWWLSWQRICLQCGRPGFNPWVGKIPWRREWQSTPVFLPGEFHGQGSPDGYHPWGLRLVVTEWLTYTHRPKWIIHHNSCGISPDS